MGGYQESLVSRLILAHEQGWPTSRPGRRAGLADEQGSGDRDSKPAIALMSTVRGA
jgi:hypothetical protein